MSQLLCVLTNTNFLTPPHPTLPHAIESPCLLQNQLFLLHMERFLLKTLLVKRSQQLPRHKQSVQVHRKPLRPPKRTVNQPYIPVLIFSVEVQADGGETDEIALYDRQIRLWGVQAQER